MTSVHPIVGGHLPSRDEVKALAVRHDRENWDTERFGDYEAATMLRCDIAVYSHDASEPVRLTVQPTTYYGTSSVYVAPTDGHRVLLSAVIPVPGIDPFPDDADVRPLAEQKDREMWDEANGSFDDAVLEAFVASRLIQAHQPIGG